MAVMMALTLTSLILRVAADNAFSPQCGAQGDEDKTCMEAPRAGSALLQTSSASATAPLTGRVVTLEAEMTALEERVSALQDSTGVSGGAGAGGVSPALQQVDKDTPGNTLKHKLEERYGSLRAAWSRVDKDNSRSLSFAEIKEAANTVNFNVNKRTLRQAWIELDVDRSGSVSFEEFSEVWDLDQKAHAPYARYALLLRSIAKADSATLKEDVASLESRAAEVKSQILTLENQVSGNAFSVKYSLLSDDVQGAQKGTSLESRVEALEGETSDMRTRVTSLEQTVVGLQLKAQ